MDKRQSQGIENMGMHLFVSGHSFAALAATIFCGMLAFYFLKKWKKSAEEECSGGASAPSFICPTPTEQGCDQYDVFLSFRGSDTRKNFTDHLYNRLVEAGLSVFKDNESIPIGEEFALQIFGAITRSKISIPIISENYATSKWCLRELVHMLDRRKSTSQSTSHKLFPILYKVEPSDVRHLQGKFGKAYRSCTRRFDKDDIPKFEQALKDVCDLHVWESEKVADGREGDLVEEVVKTVLSELRHDFQLDVNHLVGIDDHINKIRNWALSPATHARMIGIYGMGGIGKTTLAKAIYNELSKEFMGRSYISDIRDKAGRKGILYVQNQLIKDILPLEHEVSEVDHGISLIKSRFKCKEVLILLDDIDDRKQLDALAREHNWFMKGSIVIVTTRYEAVLDQSKFKVDYKYPMNELDGVHSMLLFNRQAFRMNCSPRDFEDTSREIISTMGGLPLAIEIVGSYLFGKTDLNVWKDMLKQLKEQPHEDVQAILKISYDALKAGHKDIFLDIACFFIGQKSEFAMYMWDDCGFYASEGIEELKLRCLIKIGDHGELMMHDQLRDLGRSIVGQGQSLERRSRLWDNKEASTVLMEKKGTEEIKAICLAETHRSWWSPIQTYTNEHFKKLPSLRFLKLKYAALGGDFNKLFSELRWLQWFGINLDQPFTATNLHLPKLLVLQLSHNLLTNDWGGWSSMMAAKKLKVLDLESCENLIRTPDLSALIELEILILKGCRRLEEVHSSIGKVKSLVSLDLSHCESLKELPEKLGELKELKELILDYSHITQIPTSIGSLQKLEKLRANHCESLREIPSSIERLSSLQYLELYFCKALTEIPRSIGDLSVLQKLELSETALREIPSSIGDLQNLQQLYMCWTAIEKLPSDIGRLKKLRVLRLSGTPISDLPDSIQNLSSLQELGLYQCEKLRSLPALPSTLTDLGFTCQLESIPRLPSKLLNLVVLSCSKLTLAELDGLEDLEKLEISECPKVACLDLSQNNRLKRLQANCPALVEIKGLDNLQSLEEIFLFDCNTIPRLILPESKGLKVLHAMRCDKLVEIRGLGKAKCLEKLYIAECISMEALPDLSGCEKLRSLSIEGCKKLTQLQGLEIKGLDNLQSLEKIFVDDCETIPRLILPELKGLKELCVMRCNELVEIRGLDKAKCLETLDIKGCISMEALPDLSGCEKLQFLRVRDCKNLTQLQGLEKLNLSELDISRCDSLETIPQLPRTCV